MTRLTRLTHRTPLRTTVIASVTALLSLGLLAGCSNSDAGANASSSDSSSTKDGVTVIDIASGSDSKPYSWKNEQGEQVGYDVDVAKEIDKRLPEIELRWHTGEIQSLFLGVDAGQYQVVANNLIKNPEREQKYVFGDQSYLNITYAIVYDANRITTPVTSLDDLVGKSVITFSNGSAVQNLLEGYNSSHPDKQLNLVHGDFAAGDLLLAVENGQADATVVNGPTAQVYAKEHGTNLKVVDLPADEQSNQGGQAFFLFGKDEKSAYAKEEFDKGLDEIIKDGTLSKLSLKYFDKDYTK